MPGSVRFGCEHMFVRRKDRGPARSEAPTRRAGVVTRPHRAGTWRREVLGERVGPRTETPSPPTHRHACDRATTLSTLGLRVWKCRLVPIGSFAEFASAATCTARQSNAAELGAATGPRGAVARPLRHHPASIAAKPTRWSRVRPPRRQDGEHLRLLSQRDAQGVDARSRVRGRVHQLPPATDRDRAGGAVRRSRSRAAVPSSTVERNIAHVYDVLRRRVRDCGTDPLVLEFDHVDLKRAPSRASPGTAAVATIDAEIASATSAARTATGA